MDLSIIILNYKYKDLVRTCLQNLKLVLPACPRRRAQAGDLKLNYEIIIVDNASDDGVGEMVVTDFPDVKFIRLKQNMGYSAGNNAGIRYSKGKYALILNPDITVLDGAIEKIYNFMESHPYAGVVAPQLLNPNGTIQRSCMRFHSFFIPIYRRLSFLQSFSYVKNELTRFEMADWDHNSTMEVDWMLGACLMIRKDVFNKLGLFEERFFLFFEDTDFCRRVKLNGFKVYYFSDAKVIHLDERLSNKAQGMRALKNKTTWIHISSWIKYFWKWR